MPAIHTEGAFEVTLHGWLLEHGGYIEGKAESFDRERALMPEEFVKFVQETQPERWAGLERQHGTSLERGLVDQLVKDLGKRGVLDVARHGFKYYGEKIEAAFFRPSHGLNPDLERKCAQNRLAITRQVRFDPASESSIDLLVTLNGLPVATLELKNPLSGQTVNDAVRQYRNDRDPKIPLLQFKRGALVHFAVDPDKVFMATRLSGRQTHFLPFNQGSSGAGHAGGQGNPPTADGYRTAYLWRDVLRRDQLLDIIARYIHLQREEKLEGGRTVTKETLVFPRYHQLDVVRKLVSAAAHEGPGHHYLVQHSAGSGKSNSIAWLAHRLSSLHDATDKKVFDAVVVITDRRVLDKQLQDTIYQFEHAQGVVARIDKNSAQLATELKQGTPIIITTLQKFPFVTEEIGQLPNRSYALIVDEAHSSQTGESARDLRERLGMPAARMAQATVVQDAPPNSPYGLNDAGEEDEPTYEDRIIATMASRGRQPNLSFFAFTATPKAKTLEWFGRPGPDGRPLPYHVYGMRQAIEEGFILDVLRGYTTYKTYYRLASSGDNDPLVQRKEARAALARFVSLHAHNIAQKTEVMIEHFRAHTRRKIYGRAKAMVVTRSRLHAVRYKRAFDKYIREKQYSDLKALVAFSGSVLDVEDGQEYTEVGMNGGIQERELPEKFAGPDYQVLLVANKYQTGFDQPLLHTMYVDRKLANVQAVQTLSRLNRTCPGKEDTFVLDFVNEAHEIQEAFQPFYESTTVAEQADPQQLYDLQHDLDGAQIYTSEEVEEFAKVFYGNKQKAGANEQLYRHLDPALERYRELPDDQARERWSGQLQAFVRLYAFLSQVMPFTDRDLEIRYSFGRFLLKRLPRRANERFELDGEAELEYFRLARTAEANIQLEAGVVGEMRGPTAVGTRAVADERVALSTIIDRLNELFGTDFTEADRLFIEHVVEAGKADQKVRERAQANNFENFALSIQGLVQDLVIDGLDRHDQLATRYLNEDEFKREIFQHVARRMYEDLRKPP